MARGLCACAGAAVASAQLALPFAQAAFWAAEQPGLRKCDGGIDHDPEGCPVRPEHGGPGFLSAVFSWRYALNNLRAALAGAGASAPPGAAEATVQLLGALDQLMEQPVVENLAQIAQAARGLFDGLRTWLQAEPLRPVAALAVPGPPRRWAWPSQGGTSLGAPEASFTLWTGARMPAVGFGTWRLWAKDAYQPVRWALEAGYRHIDTAEGYANEDQIGKAIQDSGIPREQLFIATKASSVPKNLNPLVHAEAVFASQLSLLGTDYVDVYMLHTVPQDPQLLQGIWQVMEGLFERGHVKALGLSNCDVNDLRQILSFARVRPAYIQNLFKVYKPGEQMAVDIDIVAVAHELQIAVMGYSVQTEWPHILPPLADPHVLAVAKAIGRTPSQVLHRWALQRGVGVIPKSATKERIVENTRLFDFALDDATMRALDGLVTLSETGAGALRPPYQEDVFGLGPPGTNQQGTASKPGVMNAGMFAAPQQQAAASTPAAGAEDPEMLRRTQGLAFSFAAIQQRLLGPGVNLAPGGCRASCLADARCMAWEVCAPVDPRAGCDGCYLIGGGGLAPDFMQMPGWHAAVERGVGLG